jgi:acyl-CoA synthetase (AMP-forming)/AMP-acid ligase II
MLLPTTPEFLRLQAARRGATGGVVWAGRHVPIATLADAAGALAGALARRGLGAGSRIGVLCGNVPAMPVMLYGIWGIGGVAVPVSTRATAAEAAGLLEHAGATALLCDEPRAPLAREASRLAGVTVLACAQAPPLAPKQLRRHTVAPRDARPARPTDRAAIASTSGSSGDPKGVVLTHHNLFWATLACAQARGDTADGVGACMSPLSHVPVLVSHLLCRFLLGATAVLFEKFDVAAVLEATARHGVTDLPLIGGMVHDMVGCNDVPAGVRASVRKISVGGAPTPMESKRRLAALFPDAEMIEAYGQTESTDGVLMSRGRVVLQREGTVGRMNPHVHVATRRPDGTLAADDEEGEIVVGGPTVMQGYHRNPRATAAALRDGWLHTGDLGRRDCDGYFFLTGRVKDLIITGGENVTPLEVEEVLRLHPDVTDVAVIGTPHPRWGEQVTAIVVKRLGAALGADELMSFAGGRLAGFKKPRRIEFVATLPRNAYNTVQTHLLKAQFSG